MDLDEWQTDSDQGIAQRDTGVGKGGGIQDNKMGASQYAFLYAVYEYAFVVALY
jgi:hypothetical protein